MKKTITVTVDAEAYLNAREKLSNLSEYVSQCLENVCKSTVDETTSLKEQMDSVDNSLNELHIKKGILQMELKKKEEQKIIQAKALKEREQFKRWKCNICKVPNFLEQTRCSKCQLPRDKYAIEVFIDENGKIVQ